VPLTFFDRHAGSGRLMRKSETRCTKKEKNKQKPIISSHCNEQPLYQKH